MCTIFLASNAPDKVLCERRANGRAGLSICSTKSCNNSFVSFVYGIVKLYSFHFQISYIHNPVYSAVPFEVSFLFMNFQVSCAHIPCTSLSPSEWVWISWIVSFMVWLKHIIKTSTYLWLYVPIYLLALTHTHTRLPVMEIHCARHEALIVVVSSIHRHHHHHHHFISPTLHPISVFVLALSSWSMPWCLYREISICSLVLITFYPYLQVSFHSSIPFIFQSISYYPSVAAPFFSVDSSPIKTIITIFSLQTKHMYGSFPIRSLCGAFFTKSE